MEELKLEFIDQLYEQDQVEAMIKEFQEKGYVILPDVLKRDSVDQFVKQLDEIKTFDGLKYTIPDDKPHYIHCANAPRGRQFLPSLLSHSQAKPFPSLHTTIIVIETEEKRGYAPDWHKDREPDGMAGKEYHYPLDVFLAFYFEDMTDDHGPTLIIPGSHRDQSLMPTTEGVQIDAIHCRKQDALLIDQRAWHRGTSRKVSGTRFLIVYGLYALPHFYGTTFHMPMSQRHEWVNAGNMRDRIFFGGPFAPPDEEALQKLLKEQNEDNGNNEFKRTFPKQT